MKLFIASDLHGSKKYVEKMLQKFIEEKCEYMLLLGDFLYHGPRNPLPDEYSPKEVAKRLNEFKDKIIAVRGNCDTEVDQMMLDFPIMSKSSYVLFNNKKIFLTHGHEYNMDNIPNIAKGDYLFFGHTHKSILEEKEGITFLNPGSISIPKDGQHSYAIMDEEKITIFPL